MELVLSKLECASFYTCQWYTVCNLIINISKCKTHTDILNLWSPFLILYPLRKFVTT